MNKLLYLYNDLINKIRPALIWITSWSLVGALFASLFDSFAEQEGINELIGTFDPALLEAFNIGSDFLTNVHSFVAGEFYTFFMLSAGIYAVFAGTRAIGSLIEKKTLLYHLTTGINRTWLYSLRFLAETISIFGTNLVLAQLLYLVFEAFVSSQDVNYGFFNTLFITIAMFQFAVFSFSQFIGYVKPLRSKSLGIGIGIISSMWLLDSIKTIEGYPDFLVPLSLYEYIDVRHFVDTFEVIGADLGVFAVIAVVFYIIGVIIFRRQNFAI
jgi:hypothetical protein